MTHAESAMRWVLSWCEPSPHTAPTQLIETMRLTVQKVAQRMVEDQRNQRLRPWVVK